MDYKILTCRLAFLVYALTMIIVGWRIWRKEHNKHATGCSEFWIANREIPGWRIGISLVAGWLMLGWLSYGMQMIYNQGLTGLWCLPLPWFIMIFFILISIPFIRRTRTISLPTALRFRFGKTTGILTALCSIFVFTSWMGAELATAGRLISPFLGMNSVICMILFIIPIILYSFLGGFRAVVLTDVIQFSVMVIFMIVLLYTGFHLAYQVPEVADQGIIATLKQMPTNTFKDAPMFSLFNAGRLLPLVLLLAYLPGWLVEQDYVLRIHSAKNLREAYKGAFFGSFLLIVLVIVMPAILAFLAIVIFQNPFFGTEENLKLISDGQNIITTIIHLGCNPVVQVLMCVGIIAVQMSTVDSFANVTSLAISHDLVEPYCLDEGEDRKKVEQRKVFWARNISIVTMIMGLIYAINNDSLLSVYNLSSGVLTASVALPLFAMFIPWVRPLGANLCVIFGFLGNAGFFYFEYYVLEGCVWEGMPAWLVGIAGYNYMMVGIIAALVGLIIGSVIGKKSTPEQLESVSKKPFDGLELFKD